MGSELYAAFLVIAHVMAASAVTVHVLLNHRDVRSAIGWIGLSWLSPFVGSTIYIMFGINRVARRASKLHLTSDIHASASISELVKIPNSLKILGTNCPPQILSIAKAGDNIIRLPLTTGNTLEIYSNGDEAYPAMLTAIENAKHSIALSSYIFAGDETGQEFGRKLIAAKARGVEVRVLVDGLGSGYFKAPIVEQLRKGGVAVDQFLHDWRPWKMTFLNMRNHKKLLIVDGKQGFTGGMNIAGENVGGAGIPEVQDVHAQVSGPIVGQLLLSFAQDWEFTTKEELTGELWWPDLAGDGAIAMRGITSGPDSDMGYIEAMLTTAIEQATKRVRIVSPYFLPEDGLFRVLTLAAVRGVEVELVIPAVTNHFYFNWATAAHLATFPLASIKCYLTPEPFDHAKLMTVDGEWASFGSTNWDARSMRLNFEFQVECYDRAATAQIDAVIDAKMKTATMLDVEALWNRPVIIKLRDAAARVLLPYL